MVLAQYYNLVRYGRAGYTYIMKNMQENARLLAERLRGDGPVRADRSRRGAAAPGGVPARRRQGFDEFDVAWQLSAERGWMVPAYTLPPNAQDVTIMRALVKETMSREHVDTLARDIEEACATLAKKGGAHESERAARSSPGPATEFGPRGLPTIITNRQPPPPADHRGPRAPVQSVSDAAMSAALTRCPPDALHH